MEWVDKEEGAVKLENRDEGTLCLNSGVNNRGRASMLKKKTHQLLILSIFLMAPFLQAHGATEARWFVRQAGQSKNQGPYSYSEVTTRIKNGTFKSTDFVWTKGFEKWAQISKTKAFGASRLPASDAAPPAFPNSADEQAPAAAKAASPWYGAVYGGLVFSPSTSGTVQNSSGVTISSPVNESDNATFQLGAEVGYQSPELRGFGGALILEYNPYKYASGAPSDTEIGGYIAPRYEYDFGPAKVWAAVGLGAMYTAIGTTSLAIGSATATFNSSALSFAFSPRIGFELPFGLGVQFSYVTSSVSVGGTVTQGSASASFTEAVTRSWWAAALRYAF